VRADPITIVPYDEHWPRSFQAQRAVLEPILADLLVGPIEHIGSTAVPGLAAKPIIDMVARVTDLVLGPDLFDRLSTVAWWSAPEPSDAELDRLSLCHPTVEHRTHHLHVVAHCSSGWPTWLAFRDQLRTHPELVVEYGELKRRLAADPIDRPRYRAAKAPLIERILREATVPDT